MRDASQFHEDSSLALFQSDITLSTETYCKNCNGRDFCYHDKISKFCEVCRVDSRLISVQNEKIGEKRKVSKKVSEGQRIRRQGLGNTELGFGIWCPERKEKDKLCEM
jgi:hypothetical protein